MPNDYYYQPNAHLSFWSGSGITTDILHNGVTMGTSGSLVADIVQRVSYKTQTKKRQRMKKSGFGGYRWYEGVLAPVEFSMTLAACSSVPLSWVHASDNADDAADERDDHPMTIPTAQSPHISATGTTAIPALCFRIESENATNANQQVDLLGCVVTELKLTCTDGEKATWEVSGLCAMVLSGVTKLSSQPADPTTTRFGWEHFAIETFTYNSQSVAFTPTSITATWTLEWEPVEPGYKADTYFVYTNWLLKSWDFVVEMEGRPYEDGTKSSVYTIARTSIASYATDLLLKWKFVRTTTSDQFSYQFDKMSLEMETNIDADRESSEYQKQTIKLQAAEGATLTATSSDLLEKAYYGGAT